MNHAAKIRVSNSQRAKHNRQAKERTERLSRRKLLMEQLEARHLMAVMYGPIDDSSPATGGYAETGGFREGGLTNGYLNDYRAGSYNQESLPTGKASWTFDSVPAGFYAVYSTWRPFENRATNAQYQIFDGIDGSGNGVTSEGFATVNQKNGPSHLTHGGVQWNELGGYYITGGELKVELSNVANGWVIADGVFLSRAVSNVTLSVTDTSAAEGGGSGTFRVSRTGDTDHSVHVPYTISTGAGFATNGSDYTSISGIATISPGSLYVDINIDPIDDIALEGPESVTITLQDADSGSDTNGYNLVSTTSGTVTISDNDLPQVTIATTDGAASETPMDYGVLTISRTGDTSAGSLLVSFAVAGVAIRSSDYRLYDASNNLITGTTITIPQHSSSTTVSIRPIDDADYEGPEAMSLTVQGGTGYNVGVPASGGVTIADDDLPLVSIVATDDTAREVPPADPQDPGIFTVSRTGITSLGSLVVQYTVSGTANNGVDYVTLNGSVTIPQGASAATITVSPLIDQVYETLESVVVTLVDASPYDLEIPTSATVDILPDKPTVTVAVADSEIAEEGQNPGTFVISRNGPTTNSLTVTYALSGSAARPIDAGSDYQVYDSSNNVLTGSITIPAGASSVMITVTPNDDTVYEEPETVVLTATASVSSPYVVGSPVAGTLTIEDNDLPTITLVATDSTAAERPAPPAEQNRGRFTFTRSGTYLPALTVTYEVSGTADELGSDYTPLSGSVSFAPGSPVAYVDVVPVADFVWEDAETVVATLDTNEDYWLNGSPSSDVVTILRDKPNVSITASIPDAYELGIVPGEFTITRDGPTTEALTVQLDFGTSTALPDDYQPLGTSFVIPAGLDYLNVPVTPVNDVFVEPVEYVVAQVVEQSSDYVIVSPGEATVSITSDDQPTVSITGGSTREGDLNQGDPGFASTIDFVVTLSDPLDTLITVSYTIESGTAEAGKDFHGTSGTIEFLPGETSKPITVKVIGDKEAELGEQFTVTLGTATGAIIVVSQATGEIEDDDYSKNGVRDLLLNLGNAVVAGVGAFVNGLTGAMQAIVRSITYQVDSCGCVCVNCEMSAKTPSYQTGQNPHPVVSIDFTLPEDEPVPDLIEAQLEFGGLLQEPVFYATDGLNPGDSLRIMLQADASTLASDRYEYTVNVTSHSGSSSKSYTTQGSQIVFNRKESNFGNRWSIADLDALEPADDGVTLLRGDGSGAWFAEDGSGGYVRPAGSFSTLTKHTDGSFTLRHEDGSKDEFDAAGLLTSRVDRQGNVQGYTYIDADTDGDLDDLHIITDEFGRTTTYGYADDDSGYVVSMTDFAGRVTGYTLDSNGFVTATTSPDPDGPGPQVSPVTHFEYDPGTGLLTKVIDPLGRAQSFNYDDFRRFESGTNPDGTTWSVTSLQAQGLVDLAAMGYDAAHPAPSSFLVPAQFAKHIDENGNLSQYKTDRFGYVTQAIDALGNITNYERDPDGQLQRVVTPDPDGSGPLGTQETRYTYDSLGNLTSITYPDNSTESWEYDPAFSQITRYEDQLGRVTTYTVNPTTGDTLSMRQIVGLLDSSGNGETDDIITSYTYSTGSGTLPVGKLLTVTDGLNRITKYEYEENTSAYDFGWRNVVISAYGTADESSLTYERDIYGNISARIDSLDRRTDFVYDALGRLVSQTDPDPDDAGPLARPVTRFYYDAANQVLQSSDPLGRITTRVYDLMGRVVRTIEPDQNATAPVTNVPGVISVGDANYTETGGWSDGSAAGGYSGSYRASSSGTGDDKATWHFEDLDPTKSYEILITWQGDAGNATNAPYRVLDGSTERLQALVNQTQNPSGKTLDGYSWYSLGVFPTSSGELTVELTDDADGSVSADAVRIIERSGLVSDNSMATYSEVGTGWQTGGASGGYESNYRVAPAGTGSNSATWTFSELRVGQIVDLHATWTTASNRATNATYKVLQDGVVVLTTAINQQTSPSLNTFDGSLWQNLGRITVTGEVTIELTDNANGFVVADAVRVVPARNVTVDDGDTGYSESGTGWSAGGNPGAYQNDYRVHTAGTGANKATWSFPNVTPGKQYQVYVTWLSNANRASNAPFTVKSNGSTLLNVQVNQKNAPADELFNSALWKGLGVIVASGTVEVELTDNADGYVIADAVRLVEIEPLVVDNGSVGFAKGGAWTLAAGGFDGDINTAAAGTGASTATYVFSEAVVGQKYEVFVTWVQGSNRATNAPYTISNDGSALPTITVNQQSAPSGKLFSGQQWKSLGIVEANGAIVVTLTNNANGVVVADGIRLVPIVDTPIGPPTPPTNSLIGVIDDLTTGYTESGSGGFTGALTGGYAGDYRVHEAGAGSAFATWEFAGLATGGTYQVFATWVENPNRATNTPYQFFDGETLEETVRVNQQLAPNQTIDGHKWQSLGTVVIDSGTLQIMLSDDANGYVIADAVRLIRVGAAPPPTTNTVYDGVGNVVSETDPLGRRTRYEYDALHRLTTVTEQDPDGPGALLSPIWLYSYGATGSLLAVTDPLENETKFRYDRLDRLIEETTADPDGDGLLTSSVTTYEYDLASQLIKTIDPLLRETEYDYDELGRLASVMQPDPDLDEDLLRPTTEYVYDKAHNLRFVTEPGGAVTEYRYDNLDRLVKLVAADPDGDGILASPETDYVYDSASQLKSVSDPLDRLTELLYDRLGRLVSVTQPDPDGAENPLLSPVTTYAYDIASRRTRTTDPLNNVTTYAYDALDNLVTLTQADPDGSGPLTAPVFSWSYDAARQLRTSTDPLSRTTSQGYDLLGRSTSITQPDPDGAGPLTSPVTSYTYDAIGNLLATTDPLGRVTSYSYDKLYRQIGMQLPDPDGVEVLASPTYAYQYDVAHQLKSVTDPLLRVTNYDYDSLGRLIEMTLPDPDGDGSLAAPVYAYGYDDALDLVTETDPLSNVTTYAFDKLHRMVTKTEADPDGDEALASPVWRFAFDAADQLTAETDPMLRVTGYNYDKLGRLVTVTQPDPYTGDLLDAPQTHYSYDAAGNLRTVTDPLTHVTTYGYDNLYRRTSITDPLAGVTAFSFDAAGQLRSLTDPEDNTTTWGYDDLGRVSVETNELNKSRFFAYDAVGNLTQRTDRNGRITQYIYDGLDRNTTEKWYAGSTLVRTLSFTFDAADQLVSAADPAAMYEYSYDGLGRLDTETQNIAGLPEIVFDSGYNANSARITVSASAGGTADFLRTYTRDSLNRVTQLAEDGQSGGNGVVRKQIAFDYNAAHQFVSIARYEGTSPTLIATTSFTYDGMGRLDDLHHTNGSTTFARYQYVFDAADRIEQITSYIDGVSDYTYDNTNQLTGADHDTAGPSDEMYEYDANGNRDSSGFTVNPNNQTATDGTYNYTYDDEGNRASKTLISTGDKEEYTWDHRNRLVAITFKNSSDVVTNTVEQTYDVWNQWIKRSVDADGAGGGGNVDSYFAYESGQITLQWEDTDGTGGTAPAMSHRYTWADEVDRFLADEQISTPGTAGNTLWGLGDHLGTLRDIADLIGGTVSIANHRGYNSFGSLTSETNSVVDLMFGYTSRPLDDASGLQNNLHRWLDTSLGRWMSEDPIGFEGASASLTRYVRNSPIDRNDPTGLTDWFYPPPAPKAKPGTPATTSTQITKLPANNGKVIAIYQGGNEGAPNKTSSMFKILDKDVSSNNYADVFLNSGHHANKVKTPTKYFSDLCKGAKANAVKGEKAQVRIVLIGFSYGADSAAKHAQAYAEEAKKHPEVDVKILVILLDQSVSLGAGSSNQVGHTITANPKVVQVINVVATDGDDKRFGHHQLGKRFGLSYVHNKSWRAYCDKNNNKQHESVPPYLNTPVGAKQFADWLNGELKNGGLAKLDPRYNRPSSFQPIDPTKGNPLAQMANNFVQHGTFFAPKPAK